MPEDMCAQALCLYVEVRADVGRLPASLSTFILRQGLSLSLGITWFFRLDELPLHWSSCLTFTWVLEIWLPGPQASIASALSTRHLPRTLYLFLEGHYAKTQGKDEFIKTCFFFFFFETRPCYVALARSAVLLPLQRLQVCTPYLACWLLSSNHAVVTAEWEGVKRKWGLLHFSGKNQT